MMMIQRNKFVLMGLAVVVLLHAGLVLSRPIVDSNPRDVSASQGGPSLSPGLATVDQIIHDRGNIVTTVDNYGYIGGWQYYGLPSGEWPRNSGHDYIGEIRYWMGAVNGTDTLVANTYDDFEAMPSLVSSNEEYTILLSTDSTRYYDYDLSDTVGLGYGNPAHGWRVWNADSALWIHPTNYSPRDSVFFPGGPVSLQESHYRFWDGALGSPLLGLELTHTILQWNYCYNEDFMFVIIEITNTSAFDYPEFAFGLYVDLDVGGPDGTGENGRLGDVVAYDSAANLAWNFEQDGYDEGWKDETGIMGTKYLETPDDLGMTGLRTGAWSLVPDRDGGRFRFLDSTGFDPILPPEDQYYIMCTRGINLQAGKTVRVVYALIAGEDSADFRNNADLAQELYDNYFVGPQPPTTPTLTARAGDRKVYLSWNDTAEVSVDPMTGEQDFSGYKIYRSDNQGRTWGDIDADNENNCLDVDYERIAEYKVNAPGEPIPRSIIDTGLYNGVQYWYAVVAYDTGASELGIDKLQNGFGIANQVTNIVAVTPRSDPAGHYPAAATVQHNYYGPESPSDGSVYPIVFDAGQVPANTFEVHFEDAPDQTVWHLIDVTEGDTLLVDQTRLNDEPNLYDIVSGLRVVVRDGDYVPRSWGQTTVGGASPTLSVPADYFSGVDYLFQYFGQAFGNQHYRSTYEFRYTGDSTDAAGWNDTLWQGAIWRVPFEVWNVSTNQRVSLAVYDVDWGLDGNWDPNDLLFVVNYPYEAGSDVFVTAFPVYFSWLFSFDASVYNPTVGDVFTIEGAPLNGPDDIFSFTPDGINASSASAHLGNVKVVPNPFLVNNWAKIQLSADRPLLHFQNLPDRCTIRIYTLAGDLVRTLEHTDGDGDETWDLLSKDRQQVASGIYFYHVESDYGEHLGRFAIIK
jgi:hypothetical protein